MNTNTHTHTHTQSRYKTGPKAVHIGIILTKEKKKPKPHDDGGGGLAQQYHRNCRSLMLRFDVSFVVKQDEIGGSQKTAPDSKNFFLYHLVNIYKIKDKKQETRDNKSAVRKNKPVSISILGTNERTHSHMRAVNSGQTRFSCSDETERQSRNVRWFSSWPQVQPNS